MLASVQYDGNQEYGKSNNRSEEQMLNNRSAGKLYGAFIHFVESSALKPPKSEV